MEETLESHRLTGCIILICMVEQDFLILDVLGFHSAESAALRTPVDSMTYCHGH